MYYTEADNVVFFSDHEAVAAALLGFFAAPDLGGRSFVAPNRLEGELRRDSAAPPDGNGRLELRQLKPVGQNNCEDERGDLEAFAGRGGGQRFTTKGSG